VFGRIPDFYGWLNEFTARAINHRHRRWGAFWQPNEPTSRVELLDDDTVVHKIAYTAANPVTAHLVSRGDKWEGVRIYQPETRAIPRPKAFFRDNGKLPATATLHIAAPKLASSSSDEQTVHRVEAAVFAAEEKVRVEAKRQGKGFVGVRRLRRQTIDDTPLSAGAHFAMSPRVASRNKWLRIERLQQCKAWLAQYRAAFERWRDSVRDVVFPHGTYAMVRHHGVAVASP
jgi:putative transposase